MNTWTVVKFISDHSVEAVPTKWLSEDYCLWPNYTKEKLLKAIRICEPALPSWERHKISTFRNATYGDYTVARKKCRQAEVTSDLNSETERKRVTKKPMRLMSSSTDSDSDSDGCFTNKDSSLPKYPEINLKKTVTQSVNVNKNSRILTNIDTDVEVEENDNITKKTTSLSSISGGSIVSSVSVNKEVVCKCCPNHRYELSTTGLIKQMLRKLSLLEMAVNEIKSRVEMMEQPEKMEPDVDIWEDFNLPLMDSEKLSEFEDFLKLEENMKKSVKQLSKVGGDTPYEFSKRAMATLLTNKLASEFSWVGLKKKQVFSKTNVADLIIRSAQVNGKTKECSIKEVEDGIKKVLRRAKERHVAEEKRLNQMS